MFSIPLFLWLSLVKDNRDIARANHMKALFSLPVDGVRINSLFSLSRVHPSALRPQIIEITRFAL